MPKGWAPDANWEPSPSWPPAPPGWNFRVPEDLKMSPLDLSRDVDLGLVSQLSVARLADVAQAAADAVAWRLCALAAETKTAPLVAYSRYQDEAEAALLEARRRIYDRLLEDGRNWINSLPTGSTEWVAATASVRPIFDSRESFIDKSRQRMRTALAASDASSAENKPAQAPKASYGTFPAAPQRAKPAGAQSRQAPGPAPAPGAAQFAWQGAQLQQAMKKAKRWACLCGIVCLLGAVVSFASYSEARSLGGQYVVLGGAIVFGAIGMVRALVRYGKLKGRLLALQRDMARPAAAAGPEGQGDGQRRVGEPQPSWGGAKLRNVGIVVWSMAAIVLFLVVAVYGSQGRKPAPVADPAPAAVTETAAGPEAACGSLVKRQLSYSRTGFNYTYKSSSSKDGATTWLIYGFVDDHAHVYPRMSFTCSVVQSTSGGPWHTTLQDLRSS